MGKSSIGQLEKFATTQGKTALVEKLTELQAKAAEHRGENGKGNVPKGIARGLRHTKAAYKRVFGEKPPEWDKQFSPIAGSHVHSQPGGINYGDYSDYGNDYMDWY